ncbi:MAG: AraC family transcriptional regulator [Beijerinckiaceae bacterium]|nr:AraC family transcriptional regulator [Beijerinckiaceae bacterium]
MTSDVLSQIFAAVKMRGTVYFHARFSPPWGIKVPRYKNVARFHLAMRGAFWVRVDGETQPVHLNEGDLIVIPHGTSHILSDSADRDARELDWVLKETGYEGSGALVYGGPAREGCQVFCGHFEFAEDALHPMLDALPQYIYMPSAETLSSNWLQLVLDFVASEKASSQPGADAIMYRLTEIIFIQVIRSFVTRAGDAAGCLAALLDPQLSRVFSAVHTSPSRGWTVEMMAKEAGLSRTAFAQRFTQLVGMGPIHYLTQWRMRNAKQRVFSTEDPLVEIAEAAGYQSQAAFTRAFKRSFGTTPGQLRRSKS